MAASVSLGECQKIFLIVALLIIGYHVAVYTQAPAPLANSAAFISYSQAFAPLPSSAAVILPHESGLLVVKSSFPPPRTPACNFTSGDYLDGRWTQTAAARAASHPPCCGWDGDIPVSPPCVRRGSSTPGRFENAGGHACKCGAKRLAQMQAFEWVPRACELAAWDARVFCSALGSRRVLFVGDSTILQLWAAVKNYIVLGNGGCAARLIYDQGDTLIGRNFGKMNRGRHWEVSAAEHSPDFVLLSAGSHITNESSFRTVLTSVRDSFVNTHNANTSASPRRRQLRLIWSTHTGANCGDAPLDRLPSQLEGYWEAQRSTRSTYQHSEFEGWDGLARAAWAGVPNAFVLDLQPLWLRPDSKVGDGDCIHSCLPGVMLIAARLLQQLLRSAPGGSA